MSHSLQLSIDPVVTIFILDSFPDGKVVAALLQRIDHLVLPVRNTDKARDFYCRVLGMQEMTSIGPCGKRKALKFGWHTLYLQEPGQPVPYAPKEEPVPGSSSLCFVSDVSFGEWQEHLNRCAVPIVEQPKQREGALGPITSFFIRDPDGNLVEIANYDI